MSSGWVTGPAAVKQLSNQERDVLLMEWMNIATQIKQLSDRETALRKQIVDGVFGIADETGTQRIELGNGWNLKAVKTRNYSVDKDHDKVEKIIAGLPVLLKDLFKKKYELATGEYKKLAEGKSQEEQNLLQTVNAVITYKPGMPSLEVEPPKTNGANGGNGH